MDRKDKSILIILFLIVFAFLFIEITDRFYHDRIAELSDSKNSIVQLMFHALFVLAYIQIIAPLITLFLSVSLYRSILNIDNISRVKKIIIYFVLLTAFFLVSYFLYGLIFIDPELLFIYILFPFPAGFSLIFISTNLWNSKITINKLISILGTLLSFVGLVGPFIFIFLRTNGLV